jgi:1,4-dihydroxy-2-naphthoate octaprenyltransferase
MYALATQQIYWPQQKSLTGDCLALQFNNIRLQILSNFANDYGDGIKGTDNEDRGNQSAPYKVVWLPASHETRYYNYISIDIVIGYVVDLLCV